ncbi:MAG: hypothetical protein R2823_08275 [Acidimicrobiia bacterium]
MADYTLVAEFDVIRRVGWQGSDDLANHLDAVTERLRQSNDVRRIESGADLDTGRVTLEVDFEAWNINRNEHSRSVLAVAIHAAGGRHRGLIAGRESEFIEPGDGSWSALRGATWTTRKFELVRLDES